MNDLPPLPQNISSDGREIWDWAKRLGEATARQHQISELRKGIRDLRPSCGTCCHWMHTNDCPREGFIGWKKKQGPSMSALPCEKHIETNWVTKLRKEREKAISDLIALKPQ